MGILARCARIKAGFECFLHLRCGCTRRHLVLRAHGAQRLALFTDLLRARMTADTGGGPRSGLRGRSVALPRQIIKDSVTALK